MQSTPLNIIVN